MGIVLGSFVTHSMINAISNIELRINRLSEDLTKIQQAAAVIGRIGSDDFSMDELLNLPSEYAGSIFNTIKSYSGMASNYAMQNLSVYSNYMNMSGQMNQLNSNPMVKRFYMCNLFKNFYNQAMKKVKDWLTKIFHTKETRINNEIKNLETQKEMFKKRKESGQKERDEAIQDFFR